MLLKQGANPNKRDDNPWLVTSDLTARLGLKAAAKARLLGA